MFKLTSLNLNGLRSAATKGVADWVAETAPDCICMQEIRVIDADGAQLGIMPPEQALSIAMEKELDLVEERGGRLFGYEIQWGKSRAKPPSEWPAAYPDAEFSLVNQENYLEFIGAG